MNGVASMKEYKRPVSMHPQKFALWLFIVSIVMIFAALTSAYVVQSGQKNWQEYELPDMMYFSTAVILVSSVFMQWSYNSAKKDNIHKVKVGLLVTLLLGVLFTVLQFYAWMHFAEGGLPFTRYVSGDFLYVLSWVHAFHLLTGIIFVMIIFIAALNYKVHSKNMLRIEMCTTYWHFLDGLWLYLFVFLLIYN